MLYSIKISLNFFQQIRFPCRLFSFVKRKTEIENHLEQKKNAQLKLRYSYWYHLVCPRILVEIRPERTLLLLSFSFCNLHEQTHHGMKSFLKVKFDPLLNNMYLKTPSLSRNKKKCFQTKNKIVSLSDTNFCSH